MNNETKMPVDKMLIHIVFIKNVIKGESDMTARCGYSHPWTPPCDSLINIEMKTPLDNILTNA
jgi:hypothetical protein